MCGNICRYLRVCGVYVYICIYIYIYIWVGGSVVIFVWIRVCLVILVYIYIYIYICINVYRSICTCLYVVKYYVNIYMSIIAHDRIQATCCVY